MSEIKYRQGWAHNTVHSSISIEPIDDDLEFFNVVKYNCDEEGTPQKEWECTLSDNDLSVISHLFGKINISTIMKED
jgi:hypothetical protein